MYPKKILKPSVVDDREDTPLRALQRNMALKRSKTASNTTVPDLPVEVWLDIIATLPLQRRVAACKAKKDLYLACRRAPFDDAQS